MRNQLLIAAVLLCASPGIAMYLAGQTSLIQAFGLVTMIIPVLMIPFGILTKGGISKLAWLNLCIVLLVLTLASGYIPLASGFSLGLSQDLVIIVSLCVVLVEIGIVVSMMFGNYKVYSLDLRKAGYDEKEFEFELRSFNKFIVLLILASIGASIGVYFFLVALPSVGIDTLSALVIAGIIYFVIARYILSQRKGLQKQPMATKK